MARRGRITGLQLALLGSAVASSPQALELAPEPLARAALSTHDQDPRPELLDDGWAVVHVAGRRHLGSDTRFDRPGDLDDALAIGDACLDPVACANPGRRLRRRAVHEDVATLAQTGRKRASLDEADCAKPAIDARLVWTGGISHEF
jgi:hypothetical protein